MQKSYYAVIPANVRYCEKIADGAKLLYGEISALCNEHGYCWATNKYFADLYKKSEDTVSRWISELGKEGFINSQVDKENGNSRKIWLVSAGGGIGKNADRVSAKMPGGYRQKCSDPIGKNADSIKENNTLNITLNNSPVFDKTGGAIPGDVQPFQSTPGNTNGQLPEPRTGLPNLWYSFDDFWRDYDFKKGSKKTARARWDKLKPADIESIRATLEIYKRETVTSDAGRNGGNFKPLRKHPEFYLFGRLWESAIDRAEEINGSEPSEFDEQYEKYTHWVEKNYPDIKRSATYLTRKQFVTMKTTSYVVGVRDIGEDGERNLLIKAHKNLSAGVNGSTVHSDVYSYHCQLIKERLKARSV